MQHSYPTSGLAFGKDPQKLFTNTFDTDLPDLRSHLADGIPGRGLDGITEACSKPDGSQNTKLVLFETLAWITNGADDLCFDIVLARNIVDNKIFDGIEKQPVDRKIPPQDVGSGVCKYYTGRAPAIDIGFVGTKGGDFEWVAAMDHQDDTELCPDRLGARKEFHDFLGARAGGDVI